MVVRAALEQLREGALRRSPGQCRADGTGNAADGARGEDLHPVCGQRFFIRRARFIHRMFRLGHAGGAVVRQSLSFGPVNIPMHSPPMSRINGEVVRARTGGARAHNDEGPIGTNTTSAVISATSVLGVERPAHRTCTLLMVLVATGARNAT